MKFAKCSSSALGGPLSEPMWMSVLASKILEIGMLSERYSFFQKYSRSSSWPHWWLELRF